MNYKLKNQLFFYLTLLIAFLLVVTNRNNGFFWDTIQLADSPTAVTTTATRDGMVTVVYYFDRIPESKAGATGA